MKKYRLFGIINPIDVLLVTALLLLVWGARIIAQPQAVEARSGRLIRYTVELGGHDAGFYRTIEAGLDVFEGIHGWHIGTVVDVYYRPFLIDVPDLDAGVVRRAPVEGGDGTPIEFTYIVIEAWADYDDYATTIGEMWVAINRMVYVRARDFAGAGFITSMEWVEEVPHD